MAHREEACTFMKLTEEEKRLIRRINKKFGRLEKETALVARLNAGSLRKFLDRREQAIIKKITNLNPRTFGFKGSHYGAVSMPRDLVPIRGQTYREKNKKKIIAPTPLLPKKVFFGYENLREAMRKEIGRTILVESGYRSLTYQIFVFLRYLEQHKWNIAKTLKRVALPGYSEHGYPTQQAVDFITTDGKPSEKEPLAFVDTKEYRWLTQNAARFGFHLSYPRGNRQGIMFEPWHWSFRP